MIYDFALNKKLAIIPNTVVIFNPTLVQNAAYEEDTVHCSP